MHNLKVDELVKYFQKHNASKEYLAHSSKVHSVGWSCDGKRLASGSFDKSVMIFMLESEKLVKEYTLRGHLGSVDQLRWHPTQSDLLSTASGDKSVRIWDIRTQKSVANVITKGENINIAWSPDGNTISVGNKEDLITFIDTRNQKICYEEQFNYEVNEISWNNSGNLFFLTNGLGCICVFKYPAFEIQQVLKAHPNTCICLEFDPTGKYFATGSADALVSLWDADELACLRVFTRLDWPVRTISFSYDGEILASASEDMFIDISHTSTSEKIADIPVESATFAVAWHPSSYILAYSCDDRDNHDRKRDTGCIKLWGLLSPN